MNHQTSYPGYPQYPSPYGLKTVGPQQPVRRRFSGWLWLLVGCVILAILIPVGLLVGIYLYLNVFGLIAPGVDILGVPVGGRTYDQAAQIVDETLNGTRLLTITDGARNWSAPAGYFGIRVDPALTVDQAYAVGRDEYGIMPLFQFLTGTPYNIVPVVTFDVELARQRLNDWAALVAIPPKDAYVQIEGNQVTAVPGENGWMLDVNTTLLNLAANPGLVMLSGNLPIQMTPVAPRISDVSGSVQEVNSLLSMPLKILAYDPITDETLDWSVPQDQLAGWVKIENTGSSLQVTLSDGNLQTYLASKQTSLGSDRMIETLPDAASAANDWHTGKPLYIILKHNPTEYIIQPGDTLISIAMKVGLPYWKILQANHQLDPDRLQSGTHLVLPSKNEMLPLPIVIGKRIIISISQQRLWTYQDGQLLNEYVISTGIASSPTQPGIFQVQTHDENAYASVWDLYMPNFLGIYEAWPGFMNGIHGLPMLSSGQRLWANVLGRPASYGCIIMTLDAAATVYQWADNGVVVEIDP